MAMLDRTAAGLLVLLLGAAPAAARDAAHHRAARRLLVHPHPAAATLGLAVAPGVFLATPFTVVAGGRVLRLPHYIGPDGTYDDQADFVRSIEGTPCGLECARRSLRRWGYAPVE